MKRALLALGSIVALLAAIVGVIGWRGLRSLDQPLHVSAPWIFKVPIGAPLSRVAADLSSRGVIAQPRAWVLYARFNGLASLVKAGEYEIVPGATPRSLLQKMLNGQVLLHSLTIVDGWRVQDLLMAMRRNPDIKSTLPTQGLDLVHALGLTGNSAEGQFLPETYRFPSGIRDVELLHQAHAALEHVLEVAWAGRDPSIPLQTAQDLLIMASIVEKESAVPEELPKIAGLYLHRFGIGMRLQADPTVIYGVGDNYDGTLHSVDLHNDGPYNTYTRAGLPPTPIALPSAAAIDATARPLKTDALYFVASDKGDGTHVFSATLDQQNVAVAKYVARLRQKAAEAAR